MATANDIIKRSLRLIRALGGDPAKLNIDVFIETLIEQAEQGVDSFGVGIERLADFGEGVLRAVLFEQEFSAGEVGTHFLILRYLCTTTKETLATTIKKPVDYQYCSTERTRFC